LTACSRLDGVCDAAVPAVLPTITKGIAMNLKTKLSIVLGSLLFAAAVYADEGKIDITGPTNISAPGSYILVNDIVGTSSALIIASSNVKLDLNGFTVSHTGAMISDGIVIDPGYKNIEITNGVVTGFTRHGIFVPGKSAMGRNIKLGNLRISDNAIDGIGLEGNSGFIVQDCLISGNGQGIYAFLPGLVINNVISNNGTGIASTSSAVNKLGYRSNVLFGNTTNVSGGANLGNNLCSGAVCP
jgi:hypothetical protein